MKDKYYHTRESVEEYIHLAKDVSGKALIEKLRKYLLPGSKVLELGSGPGTDFELLSVDYQVVGSDMSEEFLKHLNRSYTEGEFLLLDAVSLETTKKFDAIYSNKVLHHLTVEQLEASIQRQRDVLETGGIVCHSFWRGEGDEVFKGMYVKYHSIDDIQSYFSSEFEVLVLERYAEFDSDDSILLIAQKK